MSSLPRIYIKFYATVDSAGLAGADLIPVLQEWIREDVLPGTWIDVADYSHVHHGPGVLLAGHDYHLSVGQGDGRFGLVLQVRRSRGLGRDLLVALTAVHRLETDSRLAGKIKFDQTVAGVACNDGLLRAEDGATVGLASRLEDELRLLGCGGQVAAAPGTFSGAGSTRYPLELRLGNGLSLISLKQFCG